MVLPRTDRRAPARLLPALALLIGAFAPAVASAAPPARLALTDVELAVPAGFTRVAVDVTPGSIATVIVFGDRDALLHFAVDGARATDPLEEDGLLPHASSFFVPDDCGEIAVTLEATKDVTLGRVLVGRSRELPKADDAVALVGMPSPATREDGYLLERPNRYQFARPDVAMSLLEAFRETRTRYRRDPIGIADISQWNGRRPASDVDKPRHVSHEGGKDVDIALPSLEEPSTMRDHCDKEIAPDFQKAVCKKGTARAFDASRMAYFLGKLVKQGVVDKVFLDAEFIEPTARSARRLSEIGWMSSAIAEKLQPDAGILKHLAWHTDHVHVRFLGGKGVGFAQR